MIYAWDVISVSEPAAVWEPAKLWRKREIPALTVECGSGVNPLPFQSLPALWQEVAPLLMHAAGCLEYVNKL